MTFGEVHSAIDLIFRTLRTYTELLLGVTTAPVIVLQPWEWNFRKAWIPDDAAYRKVRETMMKHEQRRMGM